MKNNGGDISSVVNNPALMQSVQRLYENKDEQVVEEPQVYKPQILPKEEQVIKVGESIVAY